MRAALARPKELGIPMTDTGDQHAHRLQSIRLYELNANAVGCRDVTQQVPSVAWLQCHRKLHAFRTQLVVEGTQVAVVQEAKVIGPPGVVAGEMGKRLDRTGWHGGFAGPVAANDQGLTPQLEENVRRTGIVPDFQAREFPAAKRYTTTPVDKDS
jgi:hypothetical protein